MPENSGFLYAAYVAAALIYGGYIATLWLRVRRARSRARSLASGEAQHPLR